MLGLHRFETKQEVSEPQFISSPRSEPFILTRTSVNSPLQLLLSSSCLVVAVVAAVAVEEEGGEVASVVVLHYHQWVCRSPISKIFPERPQPSILYVVD